MTSGLRVVLASYGVPQFRFLSDLLAGLGHEVVAFTMSRSMRPNSPPDPQMRPAVTDLAASVPGGTDLLFPANADSLQPLLSGYRPDLFLVFGFNWRLPRAVFDLPRLGTVNIHTALLPQWRGPSPVPWAIRSGETSLGLTLHRVDERPDGGPVLAASRGIEVPDRVVPDDVWEATRPVLARLLPIALQRLAAGDPGDEQDESLASYAGFPTPDWFSITWDAPREEVHHRIRAAAFLGGGRGPVAQVAGRPVRVNASSTQPAPGLRVECADGPLWLVDTEDPPGPDD
ncbi:hypothetical protein KIH74_10940 [Kineosporia sp. J2-2]|uniref:Formyl transferase N-terminal domain-containing protein n=1 Tax=Kineosporia corallincola TaxID=2835133 RepID=A0ABS5THB3_9ACTN|nr:formyltransferase family protein [Kineosporia corallincola]MBT0769438.1 hypothetical protein [Kineosporia corallincola]